MNNIQIFAKALLEQIEVARIRQLSGLHESYKSKHVDTARAIGIFQKYMGLDQTGVPDPKTMHTIKMVAEAPAPTPAPAAPAAAPAAPTPNTKVSPNADYHGDVNPQDSTTVKPTANPAAKPAAAKKPFVPDPAGVAMAQQMKMDPAAIKLFQKNQGLNPDGQIGPKTTAALRAAMAKQGGTSPTTSPDIAQQIDKTNTQNTPAPAPAPAPAAPTSTQVQTDDEGNHSITTPDGKRIVVGPDGKPLPNGGKIPAPAPTPQVTPASALAAAKAPATSLTASGNDHNPEAELDPAIAASRKQFPEQPQVPAYMPGDTTSTSANPPTPGPKPPAPAPAAAPAKPAGPQIVGDDDGNSTITNPDGSSMVVGPDGKQIMPGSNPNLPQNQGALNKIGNWFSNKGQYQKPGGFQPPPGAAKPAAPASQSTDMGRPDMGVSGESFNRSNQRMVEDPELTAMLRIAGLR